MLLSLFYRLRNLGIELAHGLYVVEPQLQATKFISEAAVLYDYVGVTTEDQCVCVCVCVCCELWVDC